MKTSKLVIATTLSSAIAFGAFLESADAQAVRRRLSNTYSPTSFNQQDLISQFSLVDTTVDGIPIVDQNDDQNAGLFVDAIENFVEASGLFCTDSTVSGCEGGSNTSTVNTSVGGSYLYDSSGFPIFAESAPVTPTTTPFNANLLVQLFNPGQDPLLPSSTDITIGYTILEQTNNNPAYTFRLEPTDYSTIPGFDREQAINSLPYIFEQNLLGRTRPVRFADPIDDENSTYRYQTDFTTFTPEITFGNVLVQDQRVSTPVPEPSSMLGILAALGIGSRIKRIKKNTHA